MKRKRRSVLPSWTPWLLTGVSILIGAAFNIYDRAIERVKTQAIITTKLADLEKMIEQVDETLDQLIQIHMDEAKARNREP